MRRERIAGSASARFRPALQHDVEVTVRELPPHGSDRGGMAGRFLWKLGLFAPLVFVIGAVNWNVDPAMYYVEHYREAARHQYEAMIAGDLLAGRSHSQIAPYEEGIVHHEIFRKRPQIDVLVLGSSIAKPIHEKLFGGHFFYNAGINGARLEEYVVVYELALESGVHPGHVVLQFDGSAVGARVTPVSELAFPVFERACKRLHFEVESRRGSTWASLLMALVPHEETPQPFGATGLLHPYDTLVSPRYLQLSLQFLAQSRLFGGDAQDDRAPVRFSARHQQLIFADGSSEWCEAFLDQTAADIRRQSDEAPISSIAAEWMRPAEKTCRLLEVLINDLFRSGTGVELVLTPANPSLYDRAAKEFRREGKALPSVEAEAYLRKFAQRHAIRLCGSFDPRQAGVTEADYVDPTHLRRDAISRLIRPSTAKH